MNLLRTFFAIPLPLAAQDELKNDVQTLEKYVPDSLVRWATAINWHITLQFLPKFDRSDFDSLIEAVALRLSDFNSFELELKNLHFFPNAQHPLVIALQTEPNDKLADLSKVIGEVIAEHSYPLENRPFHGHLSLARLKDAGTCNFSLPALEFHHLVNVNQISFFESKPSKTASIYESLYDFNLK